MRRNQMMKKRKKRRKGCAMTLAVECVAHKEVLAVTGEQRKYEH